MMKTREKGILFQNQTKTKNNWVKIRLEGTESNRDAYGASVSVLINGIKQKQFLVSGQGYFSNHAQELYFGLGTSIVIDNIEVKWPNGLRQSFEGVQPNQTLLFVEGKANYHKIK